MTKKKEKKKKKKIAIEEEEGRIEDERSSRWEKEVEEVEENLERRLSL